MKKYLGRINLPLAGKHNILNALCAAATGIEAGIDFKTIAEAIYAYRGVKRRFGILMPVDGIMIIDDYAHHPTEIKATLSAAVNSKHQRIVVVFQPHRFTRTKFLKNDFADALFPAGHLVLTDIYAASEKPIPGVSAANIFNEIKRRGHKDCCYLPKNLIISHLSRLAKKGDIIMMLGAGDIGKLAKELDMSLRGAPPITPTADPAKGGKADDVAISSDRDCHPPSARPRPPSKMAGRAPLASLGTRPAKRDPAMRDNDDRG